MKTLRILAHPDPFLATKAREVSTQELLSGSADDVSLKELLGDMLLTMYANRGAGLAATQVGVGLRIFVADISPGSNSPFHVVNPVVSEPLGSETDLEGCLSVPGTRLKVERPQSVLVTGLYLDGRPTKFRANGIMARVCQHETDHLDGVLFTERAVAEARKFAVMAHAGQKRKYAGGEYSAHPVRVSKMAEKLGMRPQAVMAAALHDVKEDAPDFVSLMEAKFGSEVSELVGWLTNPSKGSELPRSERKRMDQEHLATAPADAKLIKAMDRLDNLRDMELAPEDFRTMYFGESLLLADVLAKGDSSPLLAELVNGIRKAVGGGQEGRL